MTKRFISMLLSLCLTICLCAFVPINASAETSGTCGDNLTWVLDDEGTLTISGNGAMTDYQQYKSPWYMSVINNIVIENGVTKIGDYAFLGLEDLISISMPKSLLSIGEGAFSRCTNLSKINIPENVSEIEEYAFSYCYALKDISGMEGLSIITPGLFYVCTRLNYFEIPDTVSSISEYAFFGCESLTYIKLSNNLKIIENCAFYSCQKLNSIFIPNLVTEIGEYAFYACDKLTTVYYSGTKDEWDDISVGTENSHLTNADIQYNYCDTENTVTSGTCGDNLTWVLDDEGTLTISGIGNMNSYIFGESSNYPEWVIPWLDYKDIITHVDIMEGVTSIGSYAFSGMTNLESINISASVSNIENSALNNCPKLSNIQVSDKNIVYTSEEGVLHDIQKTKILQYPIGKTDLTYTIGNTIIEIGEYAFSNSRLEEIRIPSTVTKISSGAFNNCLNLSRVYIDDLKQWCNLEFEFALSMSEYSPLANGADLYIDNKIAKEIVIPETVTKINPHIFHGCTSIEKVILPDGVQEIGQHAFEHCNNLKEIIIPDTITHIGASAFRNCINLNNIVIPENVISVSCSAFDNTGIYNNEENWENNTLYIDDYLITFKYGGTNIDDEVFKIKGGTKRIASFALNYLPFSTKSLEIPESVEIVDGLVLSSIENINVDENNKNFSTENGHLFNKDRTTIIRYAPGKKDTHYDIPDSVVKIDNAFQHCYYLKTLSIPSTVTNITNYIFTGYTKNITDIYYAGTKEQWKNVNKMGDINHFDWITIHYLGATTPITISAPTNSYAGTYYTFEATFDAMPTSAFLQFDSPADGWTWFSDEYCGANPVFNIPTDEIVEKDGKYVYQTSFVIYSSGNASDSYNRQVRVAADINGTRQYSEGTKFVVQQTPERPKNTIGYLYEQTSSPSGDTVSPEIKDVKVAKVNDKYRLKIKEITAENEDWVFFYWQTDNGEFEKVTDDFKTVDLTVSGDANVTITMGDGCGYITTKAIEIR